ncbi:MAG: F-box protein [Sulfobacillus sp.]
MKELLKSVPDARPKVRTQSPNSKFEQVNCFSAQIEIFQLMEDLPDELVLDIANMLDFSALANLSLTNSRYRELLRESWKLLFARRRDMYMRYLERTYRAHEEQAPGNWCFLRPKNPNYFSEILEIESQFQPKGCAIVASLLVLFAEYDLPVKVFGIHPGVVYTWIGRRLNKLEKEALLPKAMALSRAHGQNTAKIFDGDERYNIGTDSTCIVMYTKFISVDMEASILYRPPQGIVYSRMGLQPDPMDLDQPHDSLFLLCQNS